MAQTRTHLMSGNSASKESVYRDSDFPWVTYTGTKSSTNPGGPRNIWIADNSRSKERTGPFTTLRAAWSYIHGETLPPNERVTYNAASHTMPNGMKPAESPHIEPQTTQTPETQPTLFDEPEKEMETADQIVEFSCPHCAKPIIGLLARK